MGTLKLVTPPGAATTGNLVAEDATVTGIPDTSLLAGALRVTGTGVPTDTFVESIDSANSLTLTKAPTATANGVTLTFSLEPVTIAEARLHLRQTDTTEDPIIARMISAARRKCEKETWRTFLNSTWDYLADQFPASVGPFFGWPRVRYPFAGEIRIPNPPLVSVTSINYVDVGGSTVPLSAPGYGVTAGTPGTIVAAYGTIWPYTRGLPGDLAIRYVAGYGPTADSVPDDARLAILMMLAHLYDNRGDADVAIPGTVADLLSGVDWGGYV